MKRVGVLALQGDFLEHRRMLEELGATATEVRLPEQLTGLDGLIIPGGESTAIGRLMARYGLTEPIREMAQEGFPIWGTCAGMILMAKDIGPGQPHLGCMDLVVERNAFGRQLDSFEADLEVPVLDGIDPEKKGAAFRAIFIRAPLIKTVGRGVEVLGRLPDDGNGPQGIVAARQGRLLATCFHPELTPDTRFHCYFLKMIDNAS